MTYQAAYNFALYFSLFCLIISIVIFFYSPEWKGIVRFFKQFPKKEETDIS